MHVDSAIISRAQGCLLGQLAGDALGSLVEFRSPESILRDYPRGVRDLVDGGAWGTIAGQPTDDSELALALARMLVDRRVYEIESAREAYVAWFRSHPFDCGATIAAGLRGRPNPESQANGALMRISPLGIFGTKCELHSVAEWARRDASITHPHPVCLEVNALFAMAIAHAVHTGCSAKELHSEIHTWAEGMDASSSVYETIAGAMTSPPADFCRQQGWVLIAFRNALWQLLHAPNLEEGIVDTVMRGGDTDTNAAICGALLGAVHSRDAVPERWVSSILRCRAEEGRPDVVHPRPECYWPVDALELAERLVTSPCPG